MYGTRTKNRSDAYPQPPQRNGRRCWRGNGRPPCLLGLPDAGGLFYSWLRACLSPTLLPWWGAADASSTNGSSVFSTRGWRASLTSLVVAPGDTRRRTPTPPGKLGEGNTCETHSTPGLPDTTHAGTHGVLLGCRGLSCAQRLSRWCRRRRAAHRRRRARDARDDLSSARHDPRCTRGALLDAS